MPISLYTTVRLNQGATQFFEKIVLPLWRRFQADFSALDLCCAATVFLDQMPDWIAADTGQDPKAVRAKFEDAEPRFKQLNLAARAIKHRELDRGPDRGLKDVVVTGISKPSHPSHEKTPSFKLDDGALIDAKSLLEACAEAIAREVGVDLSNE